jgi:ABC-type glycerol-3-phosphate transport system permease component
MKVRRSVLDVVFDLFIYLFFTVFTVLCVFPFYYLLVNTISANDLVSQGQVMLLPRGVHLNNYVRVFQLRGLPGATLITLARTVLGTVLTVLCTAFAGYAVSRRELLGRKLVYRYIIITMYLGAGIVAGYLNIMRLHLINNFLVYIIPGLIGPFNLILVKTYVESIPESLHESAEIDGAGYLSIFFRLMLPLSTPILATIAIFTAVGHWNSFMDTILYIRDQRLYTLQYILWQYLNEAELLARQIQNLLLTGGTVSDPSAMLTSTSIKMTIAMIVTLPVLLVYPFFQKYFVKGIMIGAVKG